MTARQIVEMALAYKGMDKAELARNLGWSAQLLNKRLNTGKFSVEEWQAIGEAIGAYPAFTAAPTFAYIIGDYTLDRHGVLTGPHNAYLLGLLAQDGYQTK